MQNLYKEKENEGGLFVRIRKNIERKKRRIIILLLTGLLIIAALFILLRGCPDLLIHGEEKEEGTHLEDEGSAIDGVAEYKDREDIIRELERQQIVVTDKLSSNILFFLGRDWDNR